MHRQLQMLSGIRIRLVKLILGSIQRQLQMISGIRIRLVKLILGVSVPRKGGSNQDEA